MEKVAAGSVADEHLAALAGGRAALFGAVHDALLARLDAALGRTRAVWEPAEGKAEVAGNLLAGCRVWLRELAIVGWRGVDHDLVSAADQTIEALLAVPELRGLAVLLDGLATELRASSPVATMDRLPARRWADLWTRAMLLSQHGPWHGGGAEPVSGRLLILGADVHEHATVVRVQIHAVLEPAGGAPARLVRTSMAAAKVDTIVGPTVWKLLGDQPVLLSALAQHRSVEITDMPLLPGGDLVWENDRARAGRRPTRSPRPGSGSPPRRRRRSRRWTGTPYASPSPSSSRVTRATAGRSTWAVPRSTSTSTGCRPRGRSPRRWSRRPRRASGWCAGTAGGGRRSRWPCRRR
ncbi:hypothetical protein ACFQ0B_69865 [Nonomuraea thailandensis]